jgi:hypothetical protein
MQLAASSPAPPRGQTVAQVGDAGAMERTRPKLDLGDRRKELPLLAKATPCLVTGQAGQYMQVGLRAAFRCVSFELPLLG